MNEAHPKTTAANPQAVAFFVLCPLHARLKHVLMPEEDMHGQVVGQGPLTTNNVFIETKAKRPQITDTYIRWLPSAQESV